MRKMMMALGMIAGSVMVMAGGDLVSASATVAPIKAPACNVGKVYVDRNTDLMWQDAPYTDAEDGAYVRNRSFGKAGTEGYAVRYCQRLTYAGYSDWRLPTSDELQAVHHYPGETFMYSRDRDFWTSTPAMDGRYYAVYPADAYRYKRNRNQSNYIRCVRCTKQ